MNYPSQKMVPDVPHAFYIMLLVNPVDKSLRRFAGLLVWSGWSVLECFCVIYHLVSLGDKLSTNTDTLGSLLLCCATDNLLITIRL